MSQTYNAPENDVAEKKKAKKFKDLETAPAPLVETQAEPEAKGRWVECCGVRVFIEDLEV